jgi:hypothetical protein
MNCHPFIRPLQSREAAAAAKLAEAQTQFGCTYELLVAAQHRVAEMTAESTAASAASQTERTALQRQVDHAHAELNAAITQHKTAIEALTTTHHAECAALRTKLGALEAAHTTAVSELGAARDERDRAQSVVETTRVAHAQQIDALREALAGAQTAHGAETAATARQVAALTADVVREKMQVCVVATRECGIG